MLKLEDRLTGMFYNCTSKDAPDFIAIVDRGNTAFAATGVYLTPRTADSLSHP